MTEIDVVERMWDGFIGNMNDHPLHFGAFDKETAALGDDDGRLWHFTRLSVLKQMLTGRQIWLTDLSLCNDTEEICYGLRRVTELVTEIHEGWNHRHKRIVQQLAKRAAKRFTQERHVFAFSLSEERDTRQHWEAYGGGLHRTPDTNDPHIAIGFDAKALAWPLEVSSSPLPILLFGVATVEEHMVRLADYWTVRALKTLSWMEREKGDATRKRRSKKSVYDALARMLAFTCALMKHPGWRSELECRLLFINPKTFGEKDECTLPRPDSKGGYVPLTWTDDRLPIQAIVVHPLGQVQLVKRQLRSLTVGKNIAVIPSGLKPRRDGSRA